MRSELATWVPGRTLYQMHALAAAAAPAVNPDVGAADPSGDGLARLARWLDHVAALGCGGVLLTPIAVSSTHGYDVVDPFRVDQRLGSEDDFADFATACRDRDLALILDGVFHHVGRDFPHFRDVLERREASPYTEWFHLEFSRDAGDGFDYATFEGHRELVKLNHANSEVAQWARAAAIHWLERGARGWRFDAAYAIDRGFLRDLTGAILAAHPDALIFGEVIHGDYAGFVDATVVDSVTQYELYKAMWSAVNDANMFELAWALRRHESFAASFAPVTFAGNHDVTRLATQLTDASLAGVVLATLFTVPGIPCVYYGDEFGWRGRKEHRAGGDDAIRPPLPAAGEAGPMVELHRSLIALRREHPWLTTAHLEVETVTNPRFTYIVRGAERALRVSVDATGAVPEGGDGWQTLLTGRGFTIARR